MRISWSGGGRKAIGSDGSIPKAYKPWLILCLVVLVGSLMLLAADLVAAFYYFAAARPVWVTAIGVVAAMGIVVGFAGFFLMMVVAGMSTWREGRQVQVIPPVHAASEE